MSEFLLFVFRDTGWHQTISMQEKEEFNTPKIASRELSFLVCYLRGLGLVNLLGCNLGGLLYLWLAEGIDKRNKTSRRVTLCVCNSHWPDHSGSWLRCFAGLQFDSRALLFRSTEPIANPNPDYCSCHSGVHAIPIRVLTRQHVTSMFLEHHCDMCGYDLRHLDRQPMDGRIDNNGCPECGWQRKTESKNLS